MNKLYKTLQNNFFPILIILICLLLAVKNHVPGTILSGWDTLHPEFNFWLYLKRVLNGVWMEHQGLGAVASQSHPGEITKLLIVGLMGVLLPQNLVRYSFFFLCLTLGALGIYNFSTYLLSNRWHKYVHISSFLAALFYIFNLTTVQQFYVPLEMFAVHYAAAPWLFLLGYRYIRENSNHILVLFSLVTLFSSSMAHTATLFYVYIFCITLFLVTQNIKRGLFLVILTVLINSFWILPNLYFIKNHSNEVSISKINSNFTDEAFMQSQSFGDLDSLSLSKNFLFNWRGYDFSQSKFVDLLGVWKEHLEKPYVKEIGYLLFGLAIFGFIVAVFLKNKPYMYLVLPFFVSVFFWINENAPFTNIFTYLRENYPLIKEGLRFPFTKFSIIYVLILSIWFGFGSRFIINVLGKIKLGLLYAFVLAVSLIYFQLPQFYGHLISPLMKVAIPNAYFETFKWFETQDENARVARLPLNTPYGWVYNSWGYQGAGFTWFGIKQPLLDREFDRWSKYNEGFFGEASLALSNADSETLRSVITKYQVKYLFLDESVINPALDNSTLKIDQIKKVINDLGYKPVFNSEFITIYDTNLSTDSVRVVESYTAIDADLTYSKIDPLYSKYGDYVSDTNGIRYPFINLDSRGPVSILRNRNDLQFFNSVTKTNVTSPITTVLSENFDPEHGFKDAYNCDLSKKGVVGRKMLPIGRQYWATDGGVSCDYFVFSNLDSSQSYMVHVKGKNLTGRSLKIYLYSFQSKKVEIEELLPEGNFDGYFVVYPKSNPDSANDPGYTLNVETRSFGRVESENIVETLEFIPFDINLVSNLYAPAKDGKSQFESNLIIKNEAKYGSSIYKIDTFGRGLLQLGQGFEEGWVAIAFDRSSFKTNKLTHLKVNNWSNGWLVEGDQNSNSQIYIVFWPQFLEWSGFLVLLLTMVYIIVKSKKIS